MIIDTRASFSIVEEDYLKDHFPKWGKELIPTKARIFKSESVRMNYMGKIFKEIIPPHRKGNIRLKPEFVVLKNEQVQGFLLGTEYQRMYVMDICNIMNRYFTIGTNKDKKLSFYIKHMTTENILKDLLEDFKEAQYRTQLTSNIKLNFLQVLRKNMEAFAIGDEPLEKIE
ncbi:hypothetical protein O181_030329 [Austropuccinia psidii MF-1]|uniref:Uncharacterized protein n=1 Tax=Austropuccinia psidii MF-1 TaxID=1389203 RepID=A0A9Q3H5G7_9BASI|nr:hypothetical protein [Austropuccinia psidii MF-1]